MFWAPRIDAWGGNSLSSGVDCSGLVQQVFRRYGIALPRVTYQQINVGASVPVNRLQAGDLVFFDTDRNRRGPDHVGIYIGGGKFVHAPRPGQRVKISSLADSYYMQRWMGGRRIDGVTTSYGPLGDISDPEPIKLSASELAENYGMSYAFFKSQPELMKLLGKAVSGQWTGDRFSASLKNTKWWKTHSSSVRKSQVLAKTDPATYKANLGAAKAAASQAAVKMGAILSSKQLDKLAKNMTDLAWNEQQVANFLGHYVKFTSEYTLGGMAGSAAKEITQDAYRNGIKLSEQTVKNHAAYIVRGLTTMERVQADMRAQAASTYPAFAGQIMAGANMLDIAQPYIQMTAQELGLPETDIDLYHPKVRAALQRRDNKGNPAPMSLADYGTLVRSDPAWRKTPQAGSQMMAIGQKVLADMGLVK